MKKICFLHPDISQKSGGTRVLSLLCEEFKDKYEVFALGVICSTGEAAYRMDGVNYSTLFNKKIRMRYAFFAAVRKLRKFLKDNKIDIVFSIGCSPIMIVLLSAIGLKVKVVCCEHSNLLNNMDTSIAQKLSQFTGSKYSDMFVTLTSQDRDEYIKRFNLNPSKIIYIHNWIDDSLINSEYNYDLNSKKIISVGRFMPVKGYENLVDIAKGVFSLYPDWTWDIYGDGETYNNIKNLIDKNGIGDKLKLKGINSNIYNIYKEYAIFVLTSYYEGLPMVLLEAKASNLPIVSFDCPTGPREIIENGENGFLISCYDNNEMLKKICELIQKPHLREKFAQNSCNNIYKFSKDKILLQWVNLIETI